MRKFTLFIYIAIAALTVVCCTTQEKSAPAATTATSNWQQPDDSTRYGLACDGCTDTLLVFLGDIHADPDTFNILNASREHRVFGRLKIGDRVAIVLNPTDTTVADLVIDLEDLKGTWCYKVTPELRQRAGMPSEANMPPMPDSVKQRLLQPREYGFQIRSEHAVRPIGQYATDDNSPVVYPHVRRYRTWSLHNGHLILSETQRDTLGNESITHSDTTSLVTMRRDTLVLHFNEGDHGFYRKQEQQQ